MQYSPERPINSIKDTSTHERVSEFFTFRLRDERKELPEEDTRTAVQAYNMVKPTHKRHNKEYRPDTNRRKRIRSNSKRAIRILLKAEDFRKHVN